MLILLASLAAAADNGATPKLNAQVFHSSNDGRVGFSLDDAHMAPDHYFSGRLSLQYVNQPLVYDLENGEHHVLVSDLLVVDVLPSFTFGRARLGIDVPVYLLTAGEQITSAVGTGDIGLDARVVALDPASFPVGLSAFTRIGVPGSGQAVSSTAPTFDIGLAGSQTFGAWGVAANLLHHGVPAVELENVEWGSQFAFRAGVSRAFGELNGLSVELAGAATYSSFLANDSSSPAEGMIGGWHRFNDDVVARLGVGTGLSPGIGSPVARVIASVAFEPLEIRDADDDGIVDKQDACPTTAEDVDSFEDTDGCPDPDNDHDGLADGADKCADIPEDRDGWQDNDGCPDMLTPVSLRVTAPDGSSIPGAKVSIGDTSGVSGMQVDAPAGSLSISAGATDWISLKESIQIANGPPVELVRILKPDVKGGTLDLRVTRPDGSAIEATWRADGDPVQPAVGGKGSGKLLPGKHEIHVFADGFASVNQPISITLGQTTVLTLVLQPAKVVISAIKLDILEKVFFETAKTSIKKQSYPLLDEVARVLIDHPEVEKLRIEGHTDTRGKDGANLTLSDGRAKAVMAYLVKAGVAADRMSAIGFGETRPLDPAENEAAWEKNRRVEFVIERRRE